MKHALFEGLVSNESGQAATVAYVGEDPFYVILDDDFRRHVEAGSVDYQVMHTLRQQVMDHQDLVTEQAMAMIGRDDLFTKAMLDSSLRNMDRHMEEMAMAGLPEATRAWLGMMGFRVVVNVHGEVTSLDLPTSVEDDE